MNFFDNLLCQPDNLRNAQFEHFINESTLIFPKIIFFSVAVVTAQSITFIEDQTKQILVVDTLESQILSKKNYVLKAV